MITQNLHTHTVFDDGNNTPMEMARAAVDAGLTSLGFSGHSPVDFPNDWCIAPQRLADYLAAVAEAKAAYAGRLAVFSGLEWDISAPRPEAALDYVIGSVHHIAADGALLCVDESAAATRRHLDEIFGGDETAMAGAYFGHYAAIAADPAVDIVGHFDIITKFCETDGLFARQDGGYMDAAMATMEGLLKADKIFEVNTGAMARGYRTAPYPALPLLKELHARKARVLVTSDAHSAAGIAHAFGEAEALLRSVGFHEIWQLTGRGFEAVKL